MKYVALQETEIGGRFDIVSSKKKTKEDREVVLCVRISI